ncbi:hypothetical protein OG21DRAFT_1491213 [Imleria badia]|nr:hypothetical protein OG21DRAFT_1491213 [Imleria badia]
MSATIHTSIRHNCHANSTFIYVRCAFSTPDCGYTIGYSYQEISRLHTKVTLYSAIDTTRPVIIRYLSRVVDCWSDSVGILIMPSLNFYSKEFHPKSYHLCIPTQWIILPCCRL